MKRLILLFAILAQTAWGQTFTVSGTTYEITGSKLLTIANSYIRGYEANRCDGQTPLSINTIGLTHNIGDYLTIAYSANIASGIIPSLTLEASRVYDLTVTFYNTSSSNQLTEIPITDDKFIWVEFADVNASYSGGRTTTRSTGTGVMRLYLIHNPTSRTGTVRSDFGGENDVAVDFPITVVQH